MPVVINGYTYYKLLSLCDFDEAAKFLIHSDDNMREIIYDYDIQSQQFKNFIEHENYVAVYIIFKDSYLDNNLLIKDLDKHFIDIIKYIKHVKYARYFLIKYFNKNRRNLGDVILFYKQINQYDIDNNVLNMINKELKEISYELF